MDNVSIILEALSKVLWPIAFIFIFAKYSSQISNLIGSLSKRRMEVKVGDSHLTLDEASEQQVELIADLRREILEIKNDLKRQTQEVTYEIDPSKAKLQSKVVLWVDDQPQKHAYIIEHIKSLGFKVFLRSSTKEALNYLETNTPDFVISDLGRLEKDGYDSLAGIHLAKEIRKVIPSIPFYIFSVAADMVRDDVEKGILSLATSSQSELIDNLVSEIKTAPNQENPADAKKRRG